jgi:hypothetical protein
MRTLLLAAACIALFATAVVWRSGGALADCAAIRGACIDHCRNETDSSRISACVTRCSIAFCRDTPATCRPGDQAVCNDDFRSCNGACAAAAAIPSAITQDAAICATNCCNRFKACLNQRFCDTSSINCQ